MKAPPSALTILFLSELRQDSELCFRYFYVCYLLTLNLILLRAEVISDLSFYPHSIYLKAEKIQGTYKYL